MSSNRFQDTNDGAEDTLSNPYALTYVQKFQLAQQTDAGNKPVIVVLDDIEGGVQHSEQVVKYFEINDLEIVPVSPAVGLNHPVFKTNKAIHGIFLPGGPNILSDLTGDVSEPEECKSYAKRRQFERELIKLASTDIPLIGICRGHQAIGYFYGAPLKDLTDTVVSLNPKPRLVQMSQHDPKIFVKPVYTYTYAHLFMRKNPITMFDMHNDKGEDIPGIYHRKEFVGNHVTVRKGSQLYNAVEREFQENKPAYTFGIWCSHSQYLTKIPANSKLKVTMSTDDGIIEGVEISTGKYLTMGIQHHPEEYRDVVGQNHRKRLIQELKDEANQRMSDSSDPGLMQYLAYKDAREIAAINEERPQEKGAKAQLDLFIHQAQHKFCHEQPTREEDPQKYGRRLAAYTNPVTDEPGFEEDKSSTPVVVQQTTSISFAETARGLVGGAINFFSSVRHIDSTPRTRSYHRDTPSDNEVGGELSSPVAFFQDRSSKVSRETASANDTVTTSTPVAQQDDSLLNKVEYHTFG